MGLLWLAVALGLGILEVVQNEWKGYKYIATRGHPENFHLGMLPGQSKYSDMIQFRLLFGKILRKTRKSLKTMQKEDAEKLKKAQATYKRLLSGGKISDDIYIQTKLEVLREGNYLAEVADGTNDIPQKIESLEDIYLMSDEKLYDFLNECDKRLKKCGYSNDSDIIETEEFLINTVLKLAEKEMWDGYIVGARSYLTNDPEDRRYRRKVIKAALKLKTKIPSEAATTEC